MDYENAAIRMQVLKQEYRKFSAAAGLPIRLDRQQVYGFGRSAAQKARWASVIKKQEGVDKWRVL
jgi:hypothetical protein